MTAILLAALLGIGMSAAAATPDAPVAHAAAKPVAGFEVRPATLTSDRYVDLARQFAGDDPLRGLARRLNQAIALPVKLGLRYVECGEANAYYNPESKEISICFELIEQLAEDLGAQIDDDAELAEAVGGAYLFIALHEVGHALVDVLDLPITGREEDAVDQLSSWLLIGEEGGNTAVLDAAASFSLAGERVDLAERDFADQHSLDQQRYFNMVCWVYGSDPDAHAALLDADVLPATRAAGCAQEYAQLDRSWSRLLARHKRK
jgi:hypothetical protein